LQVPIRPALLFGGPAGAPASRWRRIRRGVSRRSLPRQAAQRFGVSCSTPCCLLSIGASRPQPEPDRKHRKGDKDDEVWPHEREQDDGDEERGTEQALQGGPVHALRLPPAMRRVRAGRRVGIVSPAQGLVVPADRLAYGESLAG